MLKSGAKAAARLLGLEISRYRHESQKPMPPDFDVDAMDIIRKVRTYTMTSPERLFALIEAVRYVVRSAIPGDFVECGVWRGGSMMAAAMTLAKCGDVSRSLHLFDTFDGMSQPTAEDVGIDGQSASRLLKEHEKTDSDSVWCYATLQQVKQAMSSTGYPAGAFRYVQGKVEETIPGHAPERIALLRLDTDWYESTRHELEHLFPRLVPGGVLIVDDYGHWQGARKAVDEYVDAHKVRILLNRIDYTGRIAVKSA